jgi:hypothetical protein
MMALQPHTGKLRFVVCDSASMDARIVHMFTAHVRPGWQTIERVSQVFIDKGLWVWVEDPSVGIVAGALRHGGGR